MPVVLRDALGDDPDEHSESEEESTNWVEEAEFCSGAPRGEPGTAAARDGLTEVPCGCGIRNVPSVDGVVPDEELEVDDVAFVLLFVLDKFSSRPNRGNGRDIGRSTLGRSLVRGSVGGSSFSSHNGVPGRLLLPSPCCRAALRAVGVSTSQGMIRGKECFVPLPSPELSVDNLETLRLGRCCTAALEDSRVGVVDDGVGKELDLTAMLDA